MTKKELSQLYWLNREIEKDRQALSELWGRAENVSPRFSGMPQAKGRGDKTGSCAAQMADLEESIQRNMQRCFQEQRRLTDYINTLPDSFLRQVLSWRYIHCLSWTQVALRMGGGNTADSVRKSHDRFLRREEGK